MASSNKNKTLSSKKLRQWPDEDDSESDSSESSDSSSSSEEEKFNKDLTVDHMNKDRKEDPSPVALLDMLAEVASATLKSDPVVSHSVTMKIPAMKHMPVQGNPVKFKSVPGSTIKKMSQHSEVLNLDQIRMLSDKLLLNMFSELTADELRRTYTYVCHLIPDQCQQRCSSFGNENRARLQMKAHLLGHIAELLAEANTPGRLQRNKFTAEPLHARKRRLAALDNNKRKRLTKKGNNKTTRNRTALQKNNSTLNGKCKQEYSQDHKFTKLVMCDSRTDASSANDNSLKYKTQKPRRSGKQLKEVCSKTSKPLSDNNEKFNGALNSLKNVKSSKKIAATLQAENHKIKMHFPSRGRPRKRNLKNRKNVREIKDGSPKSKDSVNRAFIKPVSFEEIIDTYNQPQHDHNYTSVSGKKEGIEDFDLALSSDDDIQEEDNSSVNFPGVAQCFNNIKILSSPYNQDANISNFAATNSPSLNQFNVQIPNIGEMIEVESQDTSVSSNKQGIISSSETQKHRRIRRIHKIVVPEEFESESSEVSDDEMGKDLENEEFYKKAPKIVKLERKPKSKKNVEEGTPEWERKLALKCIRMLRAKKKDERVALICKICKDKTFTAQATLMYHYRSHAGIKPFVCTICNTTFTRQHSLNYHMLIHNNKSRFTCDDCGRKFRHPSHFKEHMRRHTGETPFECADCGLRFKTRNTYKRHLKTRHGKLLTANGILILSIEEFLKVKTNPKRKIGRRKDKETQWPELGNTISETVDTLEEQTEDKSSIFDSVLFKGNSENK